MKKLLLLNCSNSLVSDVKSQLCDRYMVTAHRESSLDSGPFSNTQFDYIFVCSESLAQNIKESQYQNEIQRLRQKFLGAKLILITPLNSLRATIKIVRSGADDYLLYPLNIDEVELVLTRSKEMDVQVAQKNHFEKLVIEKNASQMVSTKCKAMEEVYDKVFSVADKTASVLLTGETGVGKGVIARLIHEHSTRKKGPFIPVHCGAIPETLIESELFGHEKGAFTGAIKRKLGRFELAHGGTIFLDEVGTLTPAAQIKLLQVLQDSMFQRVGGEDLIKVDTRIIAATNENLKDLSDENLFRKDLFYRLNVFPIALPPLRERLEDLPQLVMGFVERFSKIHQKNIQQIHPEALTSLKGYSWPGNIRELENLVERACILEKSTTLLPSSFPNEITGKTETSEPHIAIDTHLSLAEARNQVIHQFEKKYLTELMMSHSGKIKDVAEMADISVRQVHKLLSKYNLMGKEFRSPKSHPDKDPHNKNRNSQFTH